MAEQRSYTAPCPGCGAPVEFRSAQSAFAVCSYCRSTVVRDGETLSRIGKMAELFEDYSPLQLMARGTWQGRAFTLLGRLQYRGPTGAWTEWHALFDDDGSAWLAEDNGAYVMAFPGSSQRELPPASQFRLGATTAINGTSYQVTSNEQVALVSAQGELPKLPPLNAPFAMVELRSPANEVLSIDYGSTPPQLARGRPVALEELKLSGLRDTSEQVARARQFACPHCGAPVEVRFDSSKAVTCPSCKSLIDVSQGIGGELRHAVQDEPVEPLLALGSTGELQGASWQVVGYQHRMGTDPEDPDEQFGWEEYLLYNAKRGFVFLVDTSEGWSLVKPTTGAPSVTRDLQFADYLGTQYRQQEAYKAETSFVEGEFYWPVERGQKTFNRDFAKGANLLAMEQSPKEITWSAGTTISSDTIAMAFGLQDKKDLLKRSDAGPTAGAGGAIGCGTIILLLVIIIIVLLVVRACVESPGGYSSGGGAPRTSGGSFGGSSGGGGHK